MATDFPTTLQDLDATRGSAASPLNSPDHAAHHLTEDDTLEAIQAKIGIDGSLVTTSLDYLLKNTNLNAVLYSTGIKISDGQAIQDANGNEQIVFQQTASAVNEFEVTNAAVGNNPLLQVTGGDTNIGVDLSSKGTGALTFWAGAKARELLKLLNVASAVNEVQVSPAATGNNPLLEVTGDDTDVGLDVSTKGTGGLTFWSGTKARELLKLLNVASAVNEMQISPSATGNNPLLEVTGGDTDIGMDISSKGTGGLTLWSGTKARELLKLVNIVSAVNEFQVSPAAIGNNPILEATGGDTNIGLDITPKGTGKTRLTAGDMDLVAAAANIQVAGADPKRAMYVPSFAMYPSNTAGCAAITKVESATNKVNIQVLDFDGAGASKEFAEFGIQSPSYWDAGTVTAQFVWFATAGSGTVNWEIQGGSFADNDAIDAAYGTLQEVTDTLLATGDVHTTAETSALTIAGTPTAGDWLMFRVARDPANDTNTSDARLLGVRIRFGIKQYDDQ